MLLQLETLKLLRNKLRAKVVKRATTIFNLQCDKLSENVARITWPYRTYAVRSLTSSYTKALVLVHPLWGPFAKTCVFGARKRRLRVDGRLKRGKKTPFSKISAYAWTGPQLYRGKSTVLAHWIQHRWKATFELAPIFSWAEPNTLN